MSHIDPGDQGHEKAPTPRCPETIDLFAPRARNTDPETSHEAADSVTQSAAGQRQRCLEVLHEHGPMTADEIDALTGWRITTAGRRLPELAERQCVAMTDEKRKTRTGRNAFVWRAL